MKIYRNGDRTKKQIAITVDDCYDIKSTEDFLDLAQEFGIKRTFYPIDMNIEPEDAAVWQRMVNEGHEIGCHTQTHKSLPILKDEPTKLFNQFNRVTKAVGYEVPIKTLRPPFGNLGKGSTVWLKRQMLKAGFQHIILWDIIIDEPEETLKKIQNGSIVLFHARQKDLNLFREIFPVLQERGYEFVKITQMFPLLPETEEE